MCYNIMFKCFKKNDDFKNTQLSKNLTDDIHYLKKINIDDVIKEIYEIYNIYVTDNTYVFKSVNNWIIILKKTLITLNNENRDGIYNEKTASYRGNYFFVEKIFNKINPKYVTNKITSKFKDKYLTYIVGKYVTSDFDKDINKTYTSGIHYYKTIEPAFYMNVENERITGNVVSYYPCGKILFNKKFLRGNIVLQEHYEYNKQYICVVDKWYSENNKIIKETNYINKKNEVYQTCCYKNNVPYGKWSFLYRGQMILYYP